MSGCATGAGRASAWRWRVPPTIADSVRTEVIAPGVRVHHLVRVATPLRAHVLDIDLHSCVSVQALKGAETAVGRQTTSDLLRGLPVSDKPLATVNADFFVFTPNGVPVTALVQNGTLFAGPSNRPVLWFDDKGKPAIGTLTTTGTLATTHGASHVQIKLTSWNRPSAASVGIVDARWGQPLDSLSRPGALAMIALGNHRYRLTELPTGHNGLARGDTLMLVGHSRASLIAGDTVTVNASLAPSMPRNAVGGFPLLLRDSVLSATLDKDGAESFRGVNPRTAVGVADHGRRLLLVVIDGRQAGYSAGTSTLATAELLRDLGARDALNLDGGGSTAMALRDALSGTVRVVNKPSDATGERPVGDALAVFGKCGR